LDGVCAPVAALVMTGALVRTLGRDDYGMLVVSLAASGLSLAVIPAIAATTTRFVSAQAALTEAGGRGVARIITASLLVVAAIDLLLLGVAALFRDPLSSALFGQAIASQRSDAGELLLLGVAALGTQQVDSVLAGALRGMERFKEQAVIEVASRTALACGAIAVASLTGRVDFVLAVQCGTCLAAALLRAVTARGFAPGGRLFAVPGRMDFARVTSFGGWMWLMALAAAGFGAADRIIIVQTLGPAAAGQFNVYMQIAQLVHYAPNSVFSFSLPIFSRLGAQGSQARRELTQTYRSCVAGIVCLGLAIAVAIVLFRQPLLRLFVGQAAYSGHDLAFMLLVVTFVFHCVSIGSVYLLLALGNSRLVSSLGTALMLGAVALMPVLIPLYGLEGAATARLLHGLGTLAFIERAHSRLKRQ
jgi:O-antigen/teichoic acid export membrane protein